MNLFGFGSSYQWSCNVSTSYQWSCNVVPVSYQWSCNVVSTSYQWSCFSTSYQQSCFSSDFQYDARPSSALPRKPIRQHFGSGDFSFVSHLNGMPQESAIDHYRHISSSLQQTAMLLRLWEASMRVWPWQSVLCFSQCSRLSFEILTADNQP